MYFHNKEVGEYAFIQTCILPVRYEDFDDGIVENIVESNIKDFDIMITSSRNDKFFDLERFACRFRGGFFDNMNIGDTNLSGQIKYLKKDYWDKSRFKQLKKGDQFYETTLDMFKIMRGGLDAKKGVVFHDQSFIATKKNRFSHPARLNKTDPLKFNTPKKLFKKSFIKKASGNNISGSGSNYLSNEVMYRSTRKRDELGYNKTKEIGHVHISNAISFDEVVSIMRTIIINLNTII